MAAGDSVSVFTRWGEDVDQVWVKSRIGDGPQEVRDDLVGARPATVDRHPILGIDPVNCTPQLGRPGPWFERLPHFRMGFTPEQRRRAAVRVPRRARGRPGGGRGAARDRAAFAALVQVTELRTIAADTLWLSPQYERDTLAIHFTWLPDAAGVDRALAAIEPALAPFAARPHWGKLFRADAAELAPRYPRHADFLALARAARPARRVRQRLAASVVGPRMSVSRCTALRRRVAADASLAAVRRESRTRCSWSASCRGSPRMQGCVAQRSPNGAEASVDDMAHLRGARPGRARSPPDVPQSPTLAFRSARSAS